MWLLFEFYLSTDIDNITILERCRLKPYAPDKDALTQDFIRAVENRKKESK